jgi:hypothetical protein
MARFDLARWISIRRRRTHASAGRRRRSNGGSRRRCEAAGGGAPHGIELGGSASCTSGTKTQRGRRGNQLGRCGWRRSNSDDASRGGGARCGGELRRAIAGGVKHEDDHKQRRDATHLLARLLGGLTATKRRQNRGFDGGGRRLGLGFRRRRRTREKRLGWGTSRGGGRLK